MNEKLRALTVPYTDYDWLEVWAAVDETDDAGKPLTLIGSALIITDRKKMEEELIAAKEKQKRLTGLNLHL